MGASVKLFLEEISMWIRRLSKDHPPQHRWATSNQLRAWIEQNGGGRASVFFPCPLTGSSWSQTSERNYSSPPVLGLQLLDGRWQDFQAPESREPLPGMNLFPIDSVFLWTLIQDLWGKATVWKYFVDTFCKIKNSEQAPGWGAWNWILRP